MLTFLILLGFGFFPLTIQTLSQSKNIPHRFLQNAGIAQSDCTLQEYSVSGQSVGSCVSLQSSQPREPPTQDPEFQGGQFLHSLPWRRQRGGSLLGSWT